MGEACVHGIGEVEKVFGVSYSPEQLRHLSAQSFPETTLRKCSGSYLLVAGYPLALRDLWESFPDLFFNKRDAWFASEAFAGDAVNLGWYLLRNEPVRGSQSKSYAEQCDLLADGVLVPRSCEMAYALVLHYLTTGDRLLGEVYVRCRDIDPRGGHIDLGGFGPDGLIVGGSWDGHRSDTLGLAAAQIPTLGHPDAM